MPNRFTPDPQAVGTYFRLLRRSLWGTPAGETPALQEALEIARIQKTRGLVYQAVLDEGIPIDNKTYEMFDNLLLRTAYTHSMQGEILQRVVLALKKNGIDPILLKGEGNARQYPEPLLRECGDLDIYVGEKNYEKACKVVRGLTTQKEISEASSSDKHYHIKIDGVTVEIHRFTHVFDVNRLDPVYQKYSDEGTFSDVFPIRVDKTTVNTPAPTFNALFILVHIWHHFRNGGVGVRHLCDWTMYLHSRKDDIDLGKLSAMIGALDLWSAWKTFGYMAVNMLGLDKSEMPYYDASFEGRAKTSMDLILEEGNFGTEKTKYRRRSANYYIGKAQSLFWWIERDLKVAKIFPLETGRHILKVFVTGVRRVWLDKTGGDVD